MWKAIVLSVTTVIAAGGASPALAGATPAANLNEAVSRHSDVRAADRRVDNAYTQLHQAEAQADALREPFVALGNDPQLAADAEGRYARSLTAINLDTDRDPNASLRRARTSGEPVPFEQQQASSAINYAEARVSHINSQVKDAKRAVKVRVKRMKTIRARTTRALKSRTVKHRPKNEEWIFPLVGRKTDISSDAGMRLHPILGYNRCHAGADVGAATGTPVRAAAAGTVMRVGFDGGYGNVVDLQQPGGDETRYAHLSETSVVTGQRVPVGAKVGEVGSTGLSTGPHLHFEIRHNEKPLVVHDWYAGRSTVACDADNT